MGLASIASGLLGGGIGKAADGIAGAIDRFVETDEEKRAAALLRTKITQQPDKWQAEINRVEAGHRTLFVAGWRPFIGWVCGLGLAYQFLARPFIEVIINILIATGVIVLPAGMAIVIPALHMGLIMDLIIGMLGLGALRSYEKKMGLTV